MTRAALDAALRAAHARGDGAALAILYARAARQTTDPEAAGFLCTQAYIHALEAGTPAAAALHARLCADGRDT